MFFISWFTGILNLIMKLRNREKTVGPLRSLNNRAVLETWS
jgi:hypothetical protein